MWFFPVGLIPHRTWKLGSLVWYRTRWFRIRARVKATKWTQRWQRYFSPRNRLDPCTLLGHWNPTYPPSLTINKCLLKLGCFAKIAMKRYNGLFVTKLFWSKWKRLTILSICNGLDLVWSLQPGRWGKSRGGLRYQAIARTIRPSRRFLRLCDQVFPRWTSETLYWLALSRR